MSSQNKRKFFTLKNKRSMPTWLAAVLAFFVKCLSFTYRVRVEDEQKWLDIQGAWPAVAAIWHNRILFMAALAPRKVLQKTSVLISSSRDGEYVSAFIRFFGLGVVRGSSSKGGVHALLNLNRELENKRSVILTLDGPRGPKYSVHPGALQLSLANKCPIIPISANAKHYWKVKSWDNTQIPWPFTRLTLKIGEPFMPDEALTREENLSFIHKKMMEITED